MNMYKPESKLKLKLKNKINNKNKNSSSLKFKFFKATASFNFNLKQFITSNSHLGYEVKRWNPEMRSYIVGVRSGMHILDLQITLLNFKRLIYFISSLIKFRKHLLFASENKQIDHILKQVVIFSNQFISAYRWIGGIISNFKFLYSIINGLTSSSLNLEFIPNRRKKLRLSLEGLRGLNRLPSLLIVMNSVKSKWAMNECNAATIPIAAIVDSTSNIGVTNGSPNYIIPGNVHGFASQIFYIKVIQTSIYLNKFRERALFFKSKSTFKSKFRFKSRLN